MHGVVLLMATALGVGAAPPITNRSLDPTVRSLLEKVVEAHGGRKNLSRRQQFYWKGKKVITGGGETGEFTVRCWLALPDRARHVTVGPWEGQVNAFLTGVTNNGRAWISRNGTVEELPKRNPVVDALDNAYYCSLLPLLDDPAIRLTALVERKVGGKTAFGFEVRCRDRTTVSLYFDKKTRLLTLVEDRVEHDGKEQTRTVELSEYKVLHGMPWAMKHENRAGNFVESSTRIEEVKLLEKIDPKVFAKP